MVDEEKPVVVIDNGTANFKAGFAGDDQPRLVFPNVTGTSQVQQDPNVAVAAVPQPERYVGEEAVSRRDRLTLTQPVQRGVVTDWDSLEAVVQDALSRLSVPCLDRPVLMTELPLNPPANRELLAQMMFEKFDTPGLCIMSEGLLGLIGSGRNSGVVLSCGDGVTHVTPILEALTIHYDGIEQVNTAGSDLTSYMQAIVSESGYNLVGAAGREIAHEIKEQMCYVALDFDKEMNQTMTYPVYTLPDGNKITIGNQKFRVPEVLFRPSLIGRPHEGVHELVYKSLMKCNADDRPTLYRNIIVYGGSTLISDFGTRLKKELSLLAPPNIRRTLNLETECERLDDKRKDLTHLVHDMQEVVEIQAKTEDEFDKLEVVSRKDNLPLANPDNSQS